MFTNIIIMKEENKELHQNLKSFISKFSGISENEISQSSSLEKGLGIYGDDAVELLIAYGKEFSVDVSNFMAADYFNAEGDVILPALMRLFTGKARPAKKNLTVGHLEKGITFGRLDEDIINND